MLEWDGKELSTATIEPGQKLEAWMSMGEDLRAFQIFMQKSLTNASLPDSSVDPDAVVPSGRRLALDEIVNLACVLRDAANGVDEQAIVDHVQSTPESALLMTLELKSHPPPGGWAIVTEDSDPRGNWKADPRAGNSLSVRHLCPSLRPAHQPAPKPLSFCHISVAAVVG